MVAEDGFVDAEALFVAADNGFVFANYGLVFDDNRFVFADNGFSAAGNCAKAADSGFAASISRLPFPQGAFGHAEFFCGTQGGVQVGGGAGSFQKVLIEADAVDGFFAGLREQFHAIPAQACVQQIGQETGAGLGATIEKRVAAADIGTEAVELADPVAQVHDVFFTWSPAGLVVGAG